MTCEVLIVGGGPAGTATAIAATQRGLRTVVLERGHYDRPRWGEALAPATVAALSALGVDWGRVPNLASPGIVSVWGRSEPHATDYLFDIHGDARHVDRQSLDAELARLAVAAGATVHPGTRISDVQRTASGWRLETSQGLWDGSWLVDATGRAGALRRHFRATFHSDDGLIALSRRCRSVHPDQRLAIEAVEEGWWYVVPLPQNESLVVWLTDPDLARPRGVAWEKSLARTSLIVERVGEWCSGWQTRAAGQGGAEVPFGDGWLQVGDAALAPDPLSGSGVLAALTGAKAAAEACDGQLDGYAAHHARQQLQYRQGRTAMYAAEPRWPHAPFWHRRQPSESMS